MTSVHALLRPPVLGALAQDGHAPHVVETVERLAELHDLRPIYVHACGHHLAAPVTCRVGDPYQEPPLPDLSISEAENAYIAWRGAQPILARAGVPIGRDAYILPGGPPALALRDLARRLRATAIVAGRGKPRPRVVRYLAGDTAPGIARSFPTPAIFIDDAPLAFDDGPILCVLLRDPEESDAEVHAAATLANRAGTTLDVHVLAASADHREVVALAERSRPALVVVAQPETPPLRAFARGSLPVDLLTRCDAPLMTCPAP